MSDFLGHLLIGLGVLFLWDMAPGLTAGQVVFVVLLLGGAILRATGLWGVS